MKKIISTVSLFIMCVSLISGCAGKTTSSTNTSASNTNTVSSETESLSSTQSPTTLSGSSTSLTGHTLMIYCGAGMAKPFQKIADTFSNSTGCKVNVTFANASQIQAQIKTSQTGDFFIAGSTEELQPVADFVQSQTDLVKHIPVLAVAKGNPKKITSLSSLTQNNTTLVIGDTTSTPIGKIAQKALTDLSIYDSVHIVATTTTAPQMATVVANGQADAAIVWKENCSVDGVEIVPTTDLDSYIKTIPSALLTTSKDTAAASAFSDYLQSKQVKDIWTSFGYELVGN